jgi:beta-mannosidase
VAVHSAPDQHGAAFALRVNGRDVLVKGANWIPDDTFPSRVGRDRYRERIDQAVDAGINLLRVWGGGIYESEDFYDLCDELGLLVAQDFLFACAAYPEEPPQFALEVEAEARYQVRRLRSHPCLALWCGNNENQWIHDRAFWDRAGEKVPGSLYYDGILPRVVSELDG